MSDEIRVDSQFMTDVIAGLQKMQDDLAGQESYVLPSGSPFTVVSLSPRAGGDQTGSGFGAAAGFAAAVKNLNEHLKTRLDDLQANGLEKLWHQILQYRANTDGAETLAQDTVADFAAAEPT